MNLREEVWNRVIIIIHNIISNSVIVILESDKELWNNFLKSLPAGSNSFFRTTLLYAQCYLYRRISSLFENTSALRDYDYFEKQKRVNLESHHANKLVQILRNLEYNESVFHYLLKVFLNRS